MRRELVEGGLLDRMPRGLVGRRALAADAERGQVEQAVGAGAAVEELEQLERVRLGPEAIRLLAQRRDALLEAAALPEVEHELASGRAQRLEDAGEHATQTLPAVGREQPQARGVAPGAEGPERLSERLPAQDSRLRLVQLAEAGVEPGRERVRLQQAVAEAVDRRDPRAVDLPGEIGPAAPGELGPDPAAQLGCGALRVRDDEDRADVETALADRAREALHENRRLARSGPGRDEHLAGGLDRRQLLGVERAPHARRTRHIGQRSHQLGQSPPFGSWRTSPPRMRPASRPAVSCAPSTRRQNSASSR